VQYPLVIVSEAWFVGLVNFPQNLRTMAVCCVVVVLCAFAAPSDFVSNWYKKTSAYRWPVLWMSIAYAGGLLRVFTTVSYAPIALLFQLYEW
jgi:hypothetical protein